MALVKCTDCGGEVSTSAKACPKCGAPVPTAHADRPLDTANKIFGWIGLGILGFGVYGIHSCVQSLSKPSDVVQAVPAAAPVPNPADLEAKDAVATLREYYSSGRVVGAALWNWAECHDTTIGYEKLVACVATQKKSVDEVLARMPREVATHHPCGRAIEDAHRGIFNGASVFFHALAQFLDQNGPKLRSALRATSVSDAPDAIRSAFPDDTDDRYAAASYAHVMAVDCTKTLFQCGPPDNVCWINKVAARLGLAGDENCTNGSPHCGLQVRATGALVSP